MDNKEPATIVSSNVTPADTNKYSDEELQSMARASFNDIPQHGIFRRMLIDPTAAQMLPQTEGVHAIGKVGLFNVWNGTAPEFPFAAWAQQHRPPVSTNTKLMKGIADQLHEPEADPRIQRNLDNQFNGFLNNIYKDGESKFGSMQNVNRILNGDYHNDAERDWDLNYVHRGMQYFVNGANLSKDIGTQIDYVQKNIIDKGEQVSSDYLKTLNDYKSSFEKGYGEDTIKDMEKAREKLSHYADLEALAKQYVPANFNWGTVSVITGAKDEKGKEIPYTYSNWKIENPDGSLDVDKSNSFKSAVDNIYNWTERTGSDLGYEDKEERKKFIAQYLADKSPMVRTETLHSDRPQNTNIYTSPVQTGTVYQAQSESTTFGTGNSSVTQQALASTPITPFKVNLGTQNNVISQNTGYGEQVNLNEGIVGNIQIRRVKVEDGKLKITNDTEGNSFDAPMAQVTKPTYRPRLNQNGQEEKDPVTGQIVYDRDPSKDETYYVPLSYVANVKTTDDNTALIDQMYQDALTKNSTDATEQGNKDFQKYFGMTKIDVYKQKKTGARYTKESTTAPDYNVPIK